MRDAAVTWNFLLTGLTIALAGLSVIQRCQTKRRNTNEQIEAVIDRSVNAWNWHDAKGVCGSIRRGRRLHQEN